MSRCRRRVLLGGVDPLTDQHSKVLVYFLISIFRPLVGETHNQHEGGGSGLRQLLNGRAVQLPVAACQAAADAVGKCDARQPQGGNLGQPLAKPLEAGGGRVGVVGRPDWPIRQMTVVAPLSRTPMVPGRPRCSGMAKF